MKSALAARRAAPRTKIALWRNFPDSLTRKKTEVNRVANDESGLPRRFGVNVRILPNAPVPKRASATSTMISPRSKPRRRGKAAFETEMLGPAPRNEEWDYRAVDIGYGGSARRRLLYFTALIIVIGFVGLAASSVSWPKLSNPTETTLIGRETKGARPQPDEMADADRPAQNASIVDAQPADVSSDDRAASSAPVGIPTTAASIPSPETTPSAPPAREPVPPNMTIPAMSWRRSKKSRRGQNYCSTKRRR